MLALAFSMVPSSSSLADISFETDPPIFGTPHLTPNYKFSDNDFQQSYDSDASIKRNNTPVDKRFNILLLYGMGNKRKSIVIHLFS